jgi:hypothetical protein
MMSAPPPSLMETQRGVSKDAPRLGSATSHPWRLVYSPSKRGMVGNECSALAHQCLGRGGRYRSNATAKAVRSCKTPGSVCAMSGGVGPQISKYVSQSQSKKIPLTILLVRPCPILACFGDARHDARTTQTSLWRGSAWFSTFASTFLC